MARSHLRLWLRMLAATNEMERELKRRLRDEFETTLPRFDVLAALHRSSEGLSMSALSRRLMVTNGNTTVLVDALEQDGLVRRTVSPSDRRSFMVELTQPGRSSFEEMAAAHARWVADLFDGIDPETAEELSQGLHDARLVVQGNTKELA